MSALKSALARRGMRAEDGDRPGSVLASHAGRRAEARLIGRRWYRPRDTDPHLLRPVALPGGEEHLARALANDLLRALP